MESHPESHIQLLRLAAIVESSDDAIVSKDVNGVITSWNAAAERMFGWTAAEAVGQSIRLIIPADRQSEEDVVLSRIRRGERVDHFETVRCRRNGEQIDVSITISPMRTPDGRIVGASKIARDITERKRIERALLELRAEQADLKRRLTTIIDASGALLNSPRLDDVLPALLVVARQVLTADAVAVWHATAGVWRVAASHGLSDAFASAEIDVTTGHEHRDPSNLLILDGASDPRVATRREAYAAEGIQSVLVLPLQTANPDMRASIAFYYRTPQQFSQVERESAAGLGRLASAVIATAYLYEGQRRRRLESEFIADVSASLVAARDYRDSLARIAARAVPRLADWCVVHLQNHDDGELELVAAAGDAAVESRLIERVLRAADDDGQDAFSVERVMRTGVPLAIRRLTQDACLACAPARRAAAEALGDTSLVCVPLIAYTRTLGAITLGQRSGTMATSGPEIGFAQDLADRVALAIDSRMAYEEARNASRLKDEFLANLSHELRTPLNAIVGYAQMLRKGTMPEDRVARVYEVLDKNAQSLTQIVEDVLDISRIVSGKIRLRMQPLSIETVVQHSVETVQPGAEAKGVRIDLQLQTPAGRVTGDPDRLQQVFWNLLSNALRFTPKDGCISIVVAYQGDSCHVTVTDNGAGIDPHFLPHIFERFRQGDSRFGREHGGLGLGLAIARQIVELHGGTIVASSQGPGRGASFRVTLPATAA